MASSSVAALLQDGGGGNNRGPDIAASSAFALLLLLQKDGAFPSTIPLEEACLSSLPRQWREFQRSRPPVKFVLIGHGSKGTHVPEPLVREGFAAGQAVVELPLADGRRVLHDFLRKVVLVIDEEGRITSSYGLSWVDEDGFVFSPQYAGGVSEGFVKEAFLEHGGGTLTFRAVRRCHHREDRASPFLQEKIGVRRLFGWYGASAVDVKAAADGGAFKPNWSLIGAERAHGRGIHVSALEELLLSAHLSLQETGGAPGSVLFCAMAPGCQELVPAGSSLSEPSSPFFHSGTDAIAQHSDIGVTRSRWTVFWEKCEKTSILPLYEVTFVVV